MTDETRWTTVTLEVETEPLEELLGAGGVDPAAGLAGMAERAIADALEHASPAHALAPPRHRVTFDTFDGRRLRFEDGDGFEELAT